MDDSRLVNEAKDGSLDAFSSLVERYQSKVYNLALRMTGSPEDAADLSQEAFLNAWKGLASFQGSSSFSTWIYRLTNNVCIDFLRKEKRRRDVNALSLDDEDSGGVNLLPDPSPSPQALLEGKELKQAIRLNLLKLSPEHRQVLVLREVTGLTYAQIAQVTGLEEGTVKSRIARARLALRNLLRADGNFFASPSSNQSGHKTGGDGLGL